MKKIIFIFALIFLISLTSSEPTMTLQNENPQPYETFIGTISSPDGILSELSKTDITILEGRKQVYFDYNMYNYGKEYYFYIIFTREGNFTISVSKILYKLGDIIQESTIEKTVQVKNIIINDTKTKEYGTKKLYIMPPIFFNFAIPEIMLVNKGTLPMNITYNSSLIKLLPGGSKTITFVPYKTFDLLEFSTYKQFKVPIISLSQNYTQPNITITPLKINLKLSKTEIKLNLTEKKPETITIEFLNLGDNFISEIKIGSNIEFLKYKNITSLSARETRNVSFLLSPENPGYKKGNITIKYKEQNNNYSISLPIEIFIFSNTTGNVQISKKTCAEEGGILCNETCTGEVKYSKDGYCCFAECKKININVGSSDYTWLIVSIIVLVIIIIVAVVYKKYKKAKPETSEKKIADVSEKYQNRLKGSIKRT